MFLYIFLNNFLLAFSYNIANHKSKSSFLLLQPPNLSKPIRLILASGEINPAMKLLTTMHKETSNQ